MRLNRDGTLTAVAGGFNAPLAGLAFDGRGNLFVSHNGAISMLGAQGPHNMFTGLPSVGDHKNNHLALGPDGKLYFRAGDHDQHRHSGLDNWVLWARFVPGARDIPCQTVTLRGVNVRTGGSRRAFCP